MLRDSVLVLGPTCNTKWGCWKFCLSFHFLLQSLWSATGESFTPICVFWACIPSCVCAWPFIRIPRICQSFSKPLVSGVFQELPDRSNKDNYLVIKFWRSSTSVLSLWYLRGCSGNRAGEWRMGPMHVKMAQSQSFYLIKCSQTSASLIIRILENWFYKF